MDSRWNIYDESGNKVGEITPGTPGPSGPGCFEALGVTLIILVVVAIIAWWIITPVQAAVGGKFLFFLEMGIFWACAFVVEKQNHEKNSTRKFWERVAIVALRSGLLAGVIFWILALLTSNMRSIWYVLINSILTEIVPATVLCYLRKKKSS